MDYEVLSFLLVAIFCHLAINASSNSDVENESRIRQQLQGELTPRDGMECVDDVASNGQQNFYGHTFYEYSFPLINRLMGPVMMAAGLSGSEVKPKARMKSTIVAAGHRERGIFGPRWQL